MTKQKFSVCILALVLLPGCTMVRPLKPGTARIQSGTSTNGVRSFVSEMKHQENPAQSASQNYERTTESELPLAAGSQVTERTITPDSFGDRVINEKTITTAAATSQKTRVTERAGTMIGAAQKDTAREIGAKLASLKGVVWVGVVMFVFGLASLFYPPLKLIIGSVTTSIAITAGGVALMILPSLIAGNELLILGGVAAAVGVWFFAHRHGKLQGIVDANKNGVDDRTEAATGQ
jgi:hypothetical protein